MGSFSEKEEVLTTWEWPDGQIDRQKEKRIGKKETGRRTALGKHTGAAPPNLSPTPATSLSGFCLCLWRCWRFCKDKPNKQGLRILDLTGNNVGSGRSALCKAGLEMDHLGYFQVGRCSALVSRMLRPSVVDGGRRFGGHFLSRKIAVSCAHNGRLAGGKGKMM